MRHSIIIPLYNKAEYVEAALESIRQQTQTPAELLIVDDASTDGSLSVVYRFLDQYSEWVHTLSVQVILQPENRGPGHARNVGFAACTGDVVSFLDADDCYHPQFVETVTREMQVHVLDFLVLGIRYVPGNETDPDMDAIKGQLLPLAPELFLLPNPLETVSSPGFVMGVGCNVVARRTVMETETFETGVRLNENMDYWYRVLTQVLLCKGRVALLIGGYLQVRMVDGSLSRRTYAHWREIEYPPLLRRYIGSGHPHEKRLMGMIGKRWFMYSIHKINSRRQKLSFLWHYRLFLFRHGRHLLFGKM